jgi:polysaccharide export outer membrane protein
MKLPKVLPVLLFLSVLDFAGAQTKPLVPGKSPEPKVTTPAAVSASPAGVDMAEYVIGPDDMLQITVWKETSLSGSFPVRPDGMISLVLVGDIPAAGLTPMKLAGNIETRLKKFIQDPNVTVLVTAVNSHRIFVIGEVGHVGPLPLSAGMTPLQAIAAAGGLTAYADAKHIYILRGSQGKQLKIPFNYKNALKGNDQGVSLVVGDTIVVP